MNASLSDTIAAIGSARGPAERAVLRVSGGLAGNVAQATCSVGSEAWRPVARGAFELEFDDGEGSYPALALWMPGPKSFTAEDVLELHLPGQPALVDAALARVLSLGVRLAQPGEFTRRAFENGRIDLTRAEGVSALVTARSAAERRAAFALLSGGLDRRLADLRKGLDAARSLGEASLDFDEADTGHVPIEEITSMVSEIRVGLEAALGWERQRTQHAGRPRIALVGAPNAGKSTLFNALAQGELTEAAGLAIVSDAEGTTRDTKRGTWVLARGIEAELIDTAGRTGLSAEGLAGAAEHPALGIGEAYGEAAVRSADWALWVVDASKASALSFNRLPDGCDRSRTSLVWNQIDRQGAAPEPPSSLLGLGLPWRAISGASGLGLAGLGTWCSELLGYGEAVGDESEGGGRSAADRCVGSDVGSIEAGLGARHLGALRAARDCIDRALDSARSGIPLDLVAEDLRAATDALDEISGRTTPEDLLDRIFAQFCLGK